MIHQYNSNGMNIVLDVESGSVHIVDDLSREIIRAMDESGCRSGSGIEDIKPLLAADILNAYDDSEIKEACEEIDKLIDDGRLFAEDVYRDAVIDFKKRQTVVKALCLHVAHDCNLACAYCFAGKGEYNGKAELMSYEVGRQALDFLVANSGDRINLEVDFFGGEPLMNFDVVKRLVEYGRSIEAISNKKFRFTLTTNGVLLNDEMLDFINKEMENLVLSIDGRKEVHDKMRPMRGGQGSYDLIFDKLKAAAESRNQTNYYVRGTYTRHNLDFSNDVLHLADAGFKQISVEPVVADECMDYAIREEDVDTLLSQYDILLSEMIKRRKEGRGFNFFHFMIDLSGGPCIYKRLSGCGSGTEYLAVTPTGELYPCHQFVSDKSFLLGNVYDGITNKELRDEFKLCNVYAKEKCRDCFAKYFCSGGCAANSYNFSGNINGSYETGCRLQQKRVECAIALKACETDCDTEC